MPACAAGTGHRPLDPILEPRFERQRGEDFINTSRTQKLSLRLSEKENKKITRRALSCGLSKSAYVRQLILGYKPKESPPADYFAMTCELKEIGSNLNQLAFVANATGLIDESAYYEEVIRLRDAVQKIEQAVLGNGNRSSE